jgi:hypothetical protein
MSQCDCNANITTNKTMPITQNISSNTKLPIQNKNNTDKKKKNTYQSEKNNTINTNNTTNNIDNKQILKILNKIVNDIEKIKKENRGYNGVPEYNTDNYLESNEEDYYILEL